jgi:hypothetical protein
MRIVCLLFTLFTGTEMYAQGLDSSIINQCNTAKDAPYLTRNEKDVILYLNLVRTHPDEFSKYYLDEPARKMKLDTTTAYLSLKQDLKGRAPAQLLYPDSALTRKVSLEHAMDLGTTGGRGHKSSSGMSFHDRFIGFNGTHGECIDYKHTDGLLIVCALLIDHNEPGYGHRVIILKPVYAYTGTAIRPHIKLRTICVIDFMK